MTGILLTAIPAFCIACALTLLLARAGGRIGILDHPNERSLHDAPRPRTGGLAIWAGIAAGAVLLFVARDAISISADSPALWIAVAALVVGAVSFADDRAHVPVALRLGVHAAAAALLVAGGLGLDALRLPGITLPLGAVAGMILTSLIVVWMTNLYNFMDGIDGFAAGMAVCGFAVLGVLGALGGDAAYAALCAAIAAAAAGFLVWNFPPSRIFMGDSGASVLGLFAAALSLYGDKAGLFPLWIGVLAFSPFVVDATITLLRRIFRGARVWEAHREHYYQRLVRAGWDHRRVALRGYGLMLICGAAALAAARLPVLAQWTLIGAVTLLYALVAESVRRLENKGFRAPRATDQGEY